MEGIELIHKNNRIIVLQSKQQSVLEWYHNILIHPGEKQMIEIIKLVFTWNGLNKQVKQLIKTCHECQMYKSVFGRDMLSPVSTEVDWEEIKNNKQIKIRLERTQAEFLTTIKRVTSSP